jgi:hypothetical protein
VQIAEAAGQGERNNEQNPFAPAAFGFFLIIEKVIQIPGGRL